jgi:hypothetical protein
MKPRISMGWPFSEVHLHKLVILRLHAYMYTNKRNAYHESFLGPEDIGLE